MTGSDPEQPFAWRSALPLVLLGGGVLLLLASLLLPATSRGPSNWSTDDAKQYQAASMRLHGLSQASVHAKPAEQQQMRKDLAQAQNDYDLIRQKLDSELDRPRRFALIIRVLGIGLLSLGGIGTYLGRHAADA